MSFCVSFWDVLAELVTVDSDKILKRKVSKSAVLFSQQKSTEKHFYRSKWNFHQNFQPQNEKQSFSYQSNHLACLRACHLHMNWLMPFCEEPQTVCSSKKQKKLGILIYIRMYLHHSKGISNVFRESYVCGLLALLSKYFRFIWLKLIGFFDHKLGSVNSF